MIDTADLERCTCIVFNPAEIAQGTAFFVSSNLLLTSLHVVKEYEDKEFYILTYDKTQAKVVMKAGYPDCDLALLEVHEFQSESVATLCNETPVLGNFWASFGHPVTANGQKVGTKMTGSIAQVITKEHEYDTVLNPAEFALVKEHSGFSGSGVINAQKQVTSILQYKDINNLCSVSIKKAEAFLAAHGIPIQEDQLNDFSSYIPGAFEAIAEPFKGLGIAHAKQVAGRVTPQVIATGRMGKLMFPEKICSLKELISYLKAQSAMNSHLWRSWLEFLSFVQMLKGEYADINKVSIRLPDAEIAGLVEGVVTPIRQDIVLTLQFFFTEEKEYFTVARQYLLESSLANSLHDNYCHVFHSHTPMFGVQRFTKEDKKKVIFDISSPSDAGLKIAGSVDYGVLSFAELSMDVARSQNALEASENLKKSFINAIS